MDKIGSAFIIHLGSRPEPTALEQDLRDAGLSAQRVAAIQSPNEAPTSIVRGLDVPAMKARLGYEPSNSAIGCALSHRLVYSRMLEAGLELALVLEDDVRLDLAVFRPNKLAALASTGTPTVVQLWSRGVRLAEPQSVQRFDDHAVSFRFRYPPGQTAAYIINRQAAQLAMASPTDGPADWPQWGTQVNYVGVFPWPAREVGLPSSIPQVPTGGRGRMLATVSGYRFISSRRYLSPWDFLFRVWMPTLEAGLWRRTGRPSIVRSKEGPWAAAHVLGGASRFLSRRARHHSKGQRATEP